jgi:hypothetical protein
MDDDSKFIWFWVAVFGSAIGFWTIVVRWAWQIIHT